MNVEYILNTIQEIDIINQLPDYLLESNIFDLLFYDKYSTNLEYLYDKKIKLFDKNMKFNQKLIEEMNNKNSGFHAYQMILNKNTKKLSTLSEVASILINNGNISHLKPFIHCGYHFNVILNDTNYTCYSFHTSQSKFYSMNKTIENIKFDKNGIKFVNPLTIMKTCEFNTYYSILNHSSV
jgi:hypothetical protein